MKVTYKLGEEGALFLAPNTSKPGNKPGKPQKEESLDEDDDPLFNEEEESFETFEEEEDDDQMYEFNDKLSKADVSDIIDYVCCTL